MADAGFRLAVEGEKEFKKALAEINAQIRVNKSELKLLTAEYEINDDKLGNLQKKQATLTTEMENQSKKVKVAEERYKAWAAELGEGDAKVLRLKESLNLAQTELAQTTAEWEKNQRAIEGFERGTDNAENSLKRLDAVMAANRSEMKLVEAQYKGTADQSVKLQKQNALLQDSVVLQKQKIEQLTAALDQAEAEYGQGSEAVSGYRQELADAKIELVEMEDQIGENNRALQGSADSAEPLKNALVDVAEKLGINIPPGIENMSAGFVGAAAAAGGIALAVKKGLEAMKEVAAYADEVLTESIISGVDTTTYQQLKYMEGLMDVSTETFTSSLSRIKRAMDDAESGNDDLAEKFDRLGVSVTGADGELRDAWDVFLETVDALGNMRNETERDAIAMDLMGRSAEDLNPLIEAGADRMRELADEAERVGYVIDEEGLDASGAFQDKLDRISALADSAKNNVGLLLIETVNLGNGNATLEDVQTAWDRVKASIRSVYDVITEDNEKLKNAGNKWSEFWEKVFNGGRSKNPTAMSYGDRIREIQESVEETSETMSEITEKRISEIDEIYEKEKQSIQDSVEGRMELLEEANKQELEDYKEMQDDKLEAFEKQQSAELKAYQKAQSQRKKEFKEALDAEMDALDESHRKKLAQINEEYTERIKLVDEERYNAIQALQAQMDEIDALTEAEEKAEAERKKREELAAAEKAIADAETAEDRERAEKEYYELVEKYERERILAERDAQKQRLQNMIDATNAEYDARVEEIEKEITAKEEQATTEYEIAKAALEEEHAMRQEMFDEQMSNELEAFRETQDQQKEYFKETLNGELKDHEDYLEQKLNDLQDELDAEIKAEEKAAQEKRDIRIKYAEESISMMERLNDQYVKDLNKDITENLPFLDRGGVDISKLPQIPKYASGTLNHPGGLAIVGENGPELVNLPAGSAVFANDALRRASAWGTTINNYYQVDVHTKEIKELGDIARLAESRRVDLRLKPAEVK